MARASAKRPPPASECSGERACSSSRIRRRPSRRPQSRRSPTGHRRKNPLRASDDSGFAGSRRRRRVPRTRCSSRACAPTASGSSWCSRRRSPSAFSPSASVPVERDSAMRSPTSSAEETTRRRCRTRRPRSTKTQPTPKPFSRLANLYEGARRYEDAAATLGRYVELRPDDVDTLRRLGSVYANRADQIGAEQSILSSLTGSESFNSTVFSFPALSGFIGAVGQDPVSEAQATQTQASIAKLTDQQQEVYKQEIAVYEAHEADARRSAVLPPPRRSGQPGERERHGGRGV